MRRTIVLVAATLLAGAAHASETTSDDRHEVINKEKQAQSRTPATREEASEGAKKAAEEAANPGNTGTGASDASDATSVDRHQVINKEKQVQSKTPAAREEASEGAKKAAEEAANPESTPK